jgi:hypothetical protein
MYITDYETEIGAQALVRAVELLGGGTSFKTTTIRNMKEMEE